MRSSGKGVSRAGHADQCRVIGRGMTWDKKVVRGEGG